METLVRQKWTRIRLHGLFPELLRSHVAEAAHGPLLVEEADVARDSFGDVVGIADAEIDQHLDLCSSAVAKRKGLFSRKQKDS